MNMILLAASIGIAFVNSCYLHKMKNEKLNIDIIAFNAFISVVWGVAYVIYAAVNGAVLTNYTVLFGILYGTVLAGFLLFKSKALATGSIALTTMIGCSSFIVTTFFNVLVWNEKVTAGRIFCIVLMLAAIVLVLYPQKEQKTEAHSGISRQWIWNSILYFFVNASVGIVFRFQQTFDKDGTNTMFIIASVVSAGILFISVLMKKEKILPKTLKADRSAKKLLIKYLLICGGTGCIYNRLNIYLTGVMDNAVFFPVFNGAVVLLSATGGVILFGEKMTTRQKAGIALGCMVILVISLV